MKSNFDKYLEESSDNLHIIPALKAIVSDAKQAMSELPGWEKFIQLFWLLGPFILLIERSPADAWITILAFAFVLRALVMRQTEWLQHFWVRAGFLFWLWSIFVGALSDFPGYSVGEAVAWFRFPLFAMASTFWLARDKRLLYAMLLSTAVGLVFMCGILAAELLVEGQKNGRLMWPYGDSVPGNYLAKVGLPAFTIMVALAVSVRGRVSVLAGAIAMISMGISVMTGERINFLIRAFSGMLAGLLWNPKWGRYFSLLVLEVLAVVMIFSALPGTAARYTYKFVNGVTHIQESVWLKTINGGYQLALDNLLIGIGTGNYRLVAYRGVLSKYENVRPDVHPHNYYVQILLETGLPGFVLGVVFLWSIILSCLTLSLRNKGNVFCCYRLGNPFCYFLAICHKS